MFLVRRCIVRPEVDCSQLKIRALCNANIVRAKLTVVNLESGNIVSAKLTVVNFDAQNRRS